ncbi:hypothetical protein FOL47_009518 [Perkinsus chesapeaki]|uniref:Uncharacterized protein n=1 Tax=Perkinsus chesapeaki TaxID=330153 RepID=A0A7J6MRL3_PERCH|nr:hypothetical protein FOL47_009518 [Perkinsus chesapeaki]
MIAAHMVPVVMADPGRYVYTEKNAEYRLTIDVSKDMTVAIVFDTPNKHVTGGHLPIRRQAGDTYGIDFNGTMEGVHYWYSGIQSVYPDIEFQDGDLTTLTYVTGDSVSVTFGGKKLELVRQAFNWQVGEFVYTEDDFPSPFHHISYTVHENGQVDIHFLCFDVLSSTVSFTLADSKRPTYYKTYDLVPAVNVAKLKANVRMICSGGAFNPNDLNQVVFADTSTIFVVIHGTRYTLNRV